MWNAGPADGTRRLLDGTLFLPSPIPSLASPRLPPAFQYDIVAILKKQRQPIKDIDISVSGERAPEVPNPWKTVKMTVHLWADEGKTLDRKKVRWVEIGGIVI